MKILKHANISSFIDQFTKIIQNYVSNKPLRDLFDSQGIPLKVKRHNATRWSSHFYAYERLYKIREHLQRIEEVCLTKIPKAAWTDLHRLLMLLGVLNRHNLAVQSDTATLVDTFQALVSIMEELEKTAKQDAFLSKHLKGSPVWLDVFNYLKGRLVKEESTYIIAVTAWLCGNQANMLATPTETVYSWFEDNADAILSSAGVSVPENVAEQVKLQLAALESRKGPWRCTDVEIGKGNIINQPSLYFKRRLYKPECSLVARIGHVLLSISPSEAAVERVFSTFKLHWTPRRNALDIKTVDDILTVQAHHLLSVDSDVILPTKVNRIPLALNPEEEGDSDFEDIKQDD
jgi:hypothetical protein